MPPKIYPVKEDSTDEAADAPYDVNGVRVHPDGTIELPDASWRIRPNAEKNRLEIIDDQNEAVAYIDRNSSGDIMSGGGGGAPESSTYVTKDDESADLANSVQHANLTGTDLHDPAQHTLGGAAHGADTLANLNSKVSDATLDDAASTRPPETHGNSAHSATFVSDGDGTTRQIWVIANGAADPAGAGPEDIIFEEEA